MAKYANDGDLNLSAKHVVTPAVCAAVVTALLAIIEAILPPKQRWIIPSPMAAAIGMYITPNWTLPRIAGGLMNYLWHRLDADGAERYMIVLASGFVLGEGMASIVNAGLKCVGVSSSWIWCWGCPVGFCTDCI